MKTPTKILIHAIEFGTIERPEARRVLDYIGKLKASIRVNALRGGHTHADVDALLAKIDNEEI